MAESHTKSPQPPASLWLLSDGTAGMRLQAVALAEGLKRHRPELQLAEYTAHPHPLLRTLPRLGAWLPLPLYATAPDGKGPKHASQASSSLPVGRLENRPPMGRYPDILVTCGRRMAGLGLAIRRRAIRSGVPTRLVHIQDPRLPPQMFDALLVPKHDRARGANVVVTTGSLNRITLDGIRRAMMDLPSKWMVRDTTPTVLVMLGGDNRRYKVNPAMANAMAERLARFAKSEPMRLVLLPSRRTPAGLAEQISAALDDQRVMLVGPDEPNPYPGLLGVADAVVVTSDSVNMASETAITGRPVLIAPWRPANAANPSGERGRIRAFHDAMFAAGHTAPLGDSLPRARFAALDEMDAACTTLLGILDF